jgi:uncharacterized protein YdhG (YjbR/CyaY superfamily)
MQPNNVRTIDDYIKQFPQEVQAKLKMIREIIRRAAPLAEEAISYGMPTFRLNGNLVHFAAYKEHVGFYPAPLGIAAFKKEVSKYKWSKGAVRFPIDQPIPTGLIRSMVKFRVRENKNLK